MIRTLAFALLLLFLAVASAGEVDATKLRSGESLSNDHLSTLLAPLLPPMQENRRRRFDFVAPTLPLANPNQSDSEITLVALDLDAESGRFSGELHVQLASGAEGRLAVLGRIQDEVLLPTLDRDSAEGDRIEATDIAMAWVADHHLSRDVIVDRDGLVGLEAARRIPAGRPVREIDLREPQLVRRGDIIEISYQRDGLHISTIARAKHSGGMGDLVAVTNVDSGKDLRAQVIGRKRAQILGAGAIGP